MMEHEETYKLMMETLDGELGEADQQRLRAHLADCPSCQRQWRTILAIHQLFLQSPVLSPAAGFARRTMSRLPDTTFRIRFLGLVYGLLLIGGLPPAALAIYLVLRLRPALTEPAFVRSLFQAGEQLIRLVGTVVTASLQALATLGQTLGSHPAFVGWLLLTVGAVTLWATVYRQLTAQRQTTH
jgi:anti-sigma factor RsiW